MNFIYAEPDRIFNALFNFIKTVQVCFFIAFIIFRTLADRPETYGLPKVTVYKDDYSGVPAQPATANEPLWKVQAELFRNPVVWILGLSSALTYVSRYAINNWGILYLQEVKQYSLPEAGFVLSVGTFVGIAGGAFSGYFSDRFFNARRNVPTLIYGLLQVASLFGFFFAPAGCKWLILLSIAGFGFAISGTVVFLGGLTAVDLCPKRITGAVMGFIGLFSYMGAAMQDWVSGYLIHHNRIELANGKFLYNFDQAIYFWIGASVLSLLLACTIWNAQPRE